MAWAGVYTRYLISEMIIIESCILGKIHGYKKTVLPEAR